LALESQLRETVLYSTGMGSKRIDHWVESIDCESRYTWSLCDTGIIRRSRPVSSRGAKEVLMNCWFLVKRVAPWQAQAAWLLGLAALVAFLPQMAATQEFEPARMSRLRGELASEFELPPDELQLHVPPTARFAPGMILARKADGGIEVVDRRGDSPIDERMIPDFDLGDMAEIRDDATLWRKLFGENAKAPPNVGVRIEVREIRLLSLKERNLERLTEQALASPPAIASFRAGNEPLLIRDVFVGKVQFEVWGDVDPSTELATVLDGFRLEVDEFGLMRIRSAEEVPFAFLASRLNYQVENDLATAVKLEPLQTTLKNASAWELAEPPRTASAAAPEAPDGHEVTVLFATCRAVQAELPTLASRMSRFAGTANGLITVAVLLLVAIVIAIVLGFNKALTVLRLAATFAAALSLFLGIAFVDAQRQLTQDGKVTGIYGNKRGELRYGVSKVSVPRNRNVGEFNTPFAFYVIQLPEDPEKHFVVTELEEDREAFFRELKSKVAASADRNAFVFIHGYNVSFADAVKRTAQLNVDLNFSGAPLCYSWPSQGDLADYVHDSTNAEIAAYKLKQVLLDLNEQSGAKEIHLLAHSMGNDVLTRALKELGKDTLGHTNCVFREVLLTAPDIDTELFHTQILPAFLTKQQRITLYASSNDKALNASFKLRGSPRAGLAGEHLLVVPGIETVDVSGLDTGFLGHSYYGDHPLVVGDMLHVLRDHWSPAQRKLRENQKEGLSYWEFVP
jgi:esterase/lipase superfamily enzyme